MPYKIVEDINGNFVIKDNISINCSTTNKKYIEFLSDIALEKDTVEGPDIRSPGYKELRENEYPSITQQMDMQYWDNINNTTIWADTIQTIKDKYPKTIEESITIGEIPEEITNDIAQWLFDYQLKNYKDALRRLAAYRLADGRPEIYQDVTSEEPIIVTETLLDEEGNEYTIETEKLDDNGQIIMQDVTKSVLVQSAIEPLDANITTLDENENEIVVPNPEILQDDQERADAQTVVDNTPQEVIDYYQTSL